MTNTTPETLEKLRASLENLLSEEIGQFSNGLPAIHVTPPELPSGITCNGIQCIIYRYPRLQRSKAAVSVSQSITQNYWDIVFRQYAREVVPVAIAADVQVDDTEITVSALEGRIPVRGKIAFSDVEVRLTASAQVRATSLSVEAVPGAIASGTSGLYDPMKDLDSVVSKMRSRFPLMRERILETTEEGVFPQVSYMLQFSKITNLTR
ncbi:MAG: hypothetical protein AAFU78_14585 [Cyanobacteria bacterium J06633_2]